MPSTKSKVPSTFDDTICIIEKDYVSYALHAVLDRLKYPNICNTFAINELDVCVCVCDVHTSHTPTPFQKPLRERERKNHNVLDICDSHICLNENVHKIKSTMCNYIMSCTLDITLLSFILTHNLLFLLLFFLRKKKSVFIFVKNSIFRTKFG